MGGKHITCRQTKLFMPNIDRGKSKKILSLSKASLSTLVRNVTGHAHLDRHRRVIGEYENNTGITDAFLDHINGIETAPVRDQHTDLEKEIGIIDINLASNFGVCRLCETQGSEETPFHIATHCPYTWRGRGELYLNHTPGEDRFLSWDPTELVRFFNRYNLENR